jgi:signal transduction histidine kinase
MSESIVGRANSLVFGGLIFILVLIGATAWERNSAERAARGWSEHALQVIAGIGELNLAVRRAETGERGYLLTGDEDYLTPYYQSIERVKALSADLARQTADNPEQQQRLRAIAPLLQNKLTELAEASKARRDGGPAAAMAVMQRYTGLMTSRHIETNLDAMTAAERTLLDQRLGDAESRGEWVRILVLAGGLISVLALVVASRMLNRSWLRSHDAELAARRLAMRLRASIDSLSQGVAVFTLVSPGDTTEEAPAGWELTNWNECLEVLLGLPPSSLREGTGYAAFAQQAAAAGFAKLEREDEIRHNPSPPSEPITYELTDERDHVLEIRRTPMPDGGFVLTISDLTKRAQAEAMIRESQKMQAIGQLTGGIAHDFNNLLTVVLGNIEVIQTRLEPSNPLQVRVERAMWAAQRGATLTAQLLAFARKTPLAPAAVQLTETVPELIPLLRRTLGEHIDVRYVETAGLWPAMADAAQLESALLNLALNARDAMPGGGRLTIELANKVLDAEYARAHAEVTAGDYTMLAVSDTGHGMTPDVMSRVFEPFFTTKPDGRGTGLGLAMVFGFVKQSGGHIKIYSEPGDGTVVRIYLPRAVGGATAAQGGLPRLGRPIELPRGEATVLVVEDEPAVREIAVAILRDLGYRVFEAADGEAGLRVFGAHAADIDLLLTDVVLPGKVRGRDMADQITAIRPEVQVLFMSGYTENSIVHQGRLDDGVHLIGKPFHREQLARKVAEVLGTGRDNVVSMKRTKNS